MCVASMWTPLVGYHLRPCAKHPGIHLEPICLLELTYLLAQKNKLNLSFGMAMVGQGDAPRSTPTDGLSWAGECELGTA